MEDDTTGISAQGVARVCEPMIGVIPGPDQIVAAGQAVDASQTLIFNPNVPVVARVEWGGGDDHGPYPPLGVPDGSADGVPDGSAGGDSMTSATLTANLDHAHLGDDKVEFSYVDTAFAQYDDVYPLPNVLKVGSSLYVWGATLGDGANDDVLAASPDGTQNRQTLTLYMPRPAGEAFDVTLTTTDATDDDVWAGNTQVLGAGASTYSFTLGPSGR